MSTEVEFLPAANPVTEAETNAFQRATGFALPEQLVRFYSRWKGGKPGRAYVRVEGDENRWVQINEFLDLTNEVPKFTLAFWYNLMKDVVPSDLLIFALDPGGDFFCLQRSTGAVVHYRGEDTFKPGRTGIRHLAPTVDDLVGRLRADRETTG